ncbi:MAG: AAA family ATPase [Chitinivibrionales bacterium]|nr:AAA family ATPase [Chitinivibrionales bacterium]
MARLKYGATTESLVQRKEAKGVLPRSIAVTSGKGGVGKTNIALMLSMALSSLNKKVLLFDADLGLANVHILLGLSPRFNLSHVANEACSARDTICKGPLGIDIVPGSSGIRQMANMDSMALGILHRKLNELEQEYDFIVIDTGAGIGASTTEFIHFSDAVMLVMTPEPASLADAYAMIKVLYEQRSSDIKVIVNMSNSDREGEEAFLKLGSIAKKFLNRSVVLSGILPYDKAVPQLIRKQQILFLKKPKQLMSCRIKSIARSLCSVPSRGEEGFFGRLFGKNS